MGNEKAKSRKKKQVVNKAAYTKEIASEKAHQRGKKNIADADAFRKTRTAEKAREREKKQTRDCEAYKKEIAAEKAKQRLQNDKKMLKSPIGRRKKFFEAVREGPIFGCVCCHKIKFRNGVVRYNDALKDSI